MDELDTVGSAGEVAEGAGAVVRVASIGVVAGPS